MAKPGPKPRTDEEFKRHFWSRVNKSGDCWVWTGATVSNGYGKVKRFGRDVLAHRVAYELMVGPIPDGLCVLHRCDVKLCVNLDHLFLGTIADNNADMVAKGRQVKGECNGQAKLTSHDARLIRKAHAMGLVTMQELADRFGVSDTAIWAVVNRKTWKHV